MTSDEMLFLIHYDTQRVDGQTECIWSLANPISGHTLFTTLCQTSLTTQSTISAPLSDASLEPAPYLSEATIRRAGEHPSKTQKRPGKE